MVDWHSPEVLQDNACEYFSFFPLVHDIYVEPLVAFSKSIHCLIGLYLSVLVSWFCRIESHCFERWEFVNTLDFDWAVISGEQRFRWPLVGLCYHF